MKKKILLVLSFLLLLLINLFTPLIQINAKDTSISNSTENTSTNSNITIENGIKYYDGTIFDYPTISNSTLENATIYEESDTTKLNYYLENYRFGATTPYFNYEECVEEDLLGSNSILYYLLEDNILTLDNYDYNILKHSDDNGEYGLILFNRTITKNIYFDTNIKTISFYIDHNESAYSYLLAFNDMFDTSFEIPLLTIDNIEYLGIRFNGKDNGFQLYTKNALLNIAKNYSDNSNGICNYIAKVTIPRVDSFKEISYTYFYDYSLSLLENGNISKENLSYNKMYFAFDTEMSNKFYDYAFDIKSVNLEEKYFVVNQTSYSNIYLEEENTTASLSSSRFHSITFEITYSKKIYNNKQPYNLCSSYLSEYPEYTCSLTNSTLQSGDTLNLVQLRGTYEVDIDNEIGYVDGLVRYVYFENWSVPDNFNDYSFKIKYINFYPYVTGMSELSKYNFIQDYTQVNYQKYTMSVDKTIGIFTFKGNFKETSTRHYNDDYVMYDTAFFRFTNEVLEDLLGTYSVSYKQVISFSFYFDEERTLKIPNIKRILFRYQKGFKEANSNNELGFYLEDKYNNTYKSVKTFDFTIDNSYDGSIREIDDNLYFSKKSLLFETLEPDLYSYDYHFLNTYSYIGKKDNYKNHINAFAPIEIYYETASYETIKLVGNSQGLHIVYDEYGNGNVYDSEGNLKTDYGIFLDEQGYSFPALDLNNDGIYSSNEVVNTDTGVFDNLSKYSNSSGTIDKIKNEIEEFFKNIGDFFKELGDKISVIGQVITIILGIVALLTIYVFVISPIIKWITMLFKKLFKKKNE